VAVIYTEKMQQMYEWFNHNTLLGVEGFDVYWTNSSVTPESDESKTSPPSPFSYPGVRWVKFQHLPLEERYLYSQTTVYNECVYRNRHTYEYLMMFDTDEFLVLKDRRYADERGLERWLRHTFSPLQAAIGVYRYAYRDDCQEGDAQAVGSTYLEKFTHRIEEPESKTVLNSKRFADKLIIKPLRCHRFYMHFLQSTREGFELQTMNTQPSLVFLKHLRSYGQDCNQLVTEDPYDQ